MKLRLLVSTMSVASRAGRAQDLPYQMPPKAIATLADTPPTPRVSLSPNGSGLLMLNGQDMPTIAELSQPELRLAGLRINPRTTGPRGHSWREDTPATVYWVEAQDGGNPKTAPPIRDKVFTLLTPFEGNPQELAALPMRYAGMYWGTDKLALVQGYRWADRQETTWTPARKTR